MKSLWNWLGGAGFVPAPVAPATCNQWRAWVLVWPFAIACLLGIYLLGMGIGAAWKQAGLSLPSWSAKAQQPTITTVTNTVTEMEKVTVPPQGVMENNHIQAIAAPGSHIEAKLIGQIVNSYPNAKVVPSKVTKGSVTVGGEGTSVIEIPVLLGKSLWFTTPAGVTAEWQDHKGQWGPVPIGETPNQQKVRFTSTNNKPVQFDLLWTDLL